MLVPLLPSGVAASTIASSGGLPLACASIFTLFKPVNINDTYNCGDFTWYILYGALQSIQSLSEELGYLCF